MPETVFTRVARPEGHDYRFFHWLTFAQLLHRETLSGLVALSVLGRRLNIDDRRILDGCAVVVTAADPRIWPLKVARLASSWGSAAAGVAAGYIYASRGRLGPVAVCAAARFLVDYHEHGRSAEAMVRQVGGAELSAVGFGVLFRQSDERFAALEQLVQLENRADRTFWSRLQELREAAKAEFGLVPHVSIGLAAVLLDLGASPEKAASLVAGLYLHTFLANAVESAEQQSEIMQCLPDEAIEYVGPAPRKSPRAIAAEQNEHSK